MNIIKNTIKPNTSFPILPKNIKNSNIIPNKIRKTTYDFILYCFVSL